MFIAIRDWIDARRRKAERDAFNKGYEFAKHQLAIGNYTADALEALASGSFNEHANQRAFDRGVLAAVQDARHA